MDAKMQQKLSFAQSKGKGLHIQSSLDEIFLDPIVQNQMVNLHALSLSNDQYEMMEVFPQCRLTQLSNQIFSNLSFEKSGFGVPDIHEEDQSDFLLLKDCEVDCNLMICGIEWNQNVKKSNQMVSLLLEAPKSQENEVLEEANFAVGSEVVNSYPQVLEMLKKHCLTVAELIFNIEPLSLHFEVKSDLSEMMVVATWWIWMKLILDMFMSCMSMFLEFEVAHIYHVGVFEEQTSVSKVDNSDFLIGEVEDLILRMQDLESLNSVIHVSYCLDQIVKDQSKRVLLTLILQNSVGFKKDALFWMFLMMNLHNLMTKMIESQKRSCFDPDLPQMFDVDKEEFVCHLEMIITDCWKNFVYLERFSEASQISDFQKIQKSKFLM